MKKGGLGKGLDAILPDEIISEMASIKDEVRLEHIPLDKIVPNPFQPREEIDKKSIEELAQSIREQGVIQPILVSRDADKYVLIAGERRWLAGKIAGLNLIPALVLPATPSPEKMLFLALVENLQRQDLDPVEEGEAYLKLSEQFNLTQDEIARKVGKSRPAISNAIRILKLPTPVLNMLKKRELTEGHARILLEEPDPNRQIRLAKLCATRGLPIERLMLLVKSKKAKRSQIKRQKNPQFLVWEDELSAVIGSPVKISAGKKKGKLIIEFSDIAHLQKIVEILMQIEN